MRTRIALVPLLLVAVGTATAWGHAFLDHASPLVGGTVPASPREVTLWFTESLEPAFSSLEVSDSKGVRVDQGKAAVSGNTMRVGVKTLAPGSYKVRWHALSVDTHRSEGSFSFQVGGK